MSDFVQVRKTSRHAILTLQRPEKRNPLPYLPEHGLLPALEKCRRDSRVRAIVITGAGSAFCSGLDLEGLREIRKATQRKNLSDSRKIRDFFEALRTFPKPLLAALNGPAVAGGAGLALVCDLAIAAENASFCFSEVKIGFVPALVSVYLERAVGARVARELLLSGRVVPAQEAQALHLVHEVTPTAGLLARAEELAEQWAAHSPEAMRRTKELLARTAGLPVKTALSLATQANAQARGTPDCQEGIQAFLEKRKPEWLS